MAQLTHTQEAILLLAGFSAYLRWGDLAFDHLVAWLERRFPGFHAKHPRKD